MYETRYLQGVQARRNLAAWLSSKAVFNRKLVPTNRCTTWVNLESHTKLRIWVWISLAKCNIFVTLGLDCNRVDRSQNRTCNAELSSIKPESRESIQSKITEPACAEFSAKQRGNSAKKITFPSSKRLFLSFTKRNLLTLNLTFIVYED